MQNHYTFVQFSILHAVLDCFFIYFQQLKLDFLMKDPHIFAGYIHTLYAIQSQKLKNLTYKWIIVTKEILTLRRPSRFTTVKEKIPENTKYNKTGCCTDKCSPTKKLQYLTNYFFHFII